MRLTYAIKFVADMDKAIAFYRDTLGFRLAFQSPYWSEFETGETSSRSIPRPTKTRPEARSLASGSTASANSMHAAVSSGSTSPSRRRNGTERTSPGSVIAKAPKSP